MAIQGENRILAILLLDSREHIKNSVAAFFYVSRKILPDNFTVNLLTQKPPESGEISGIVVG
jgi:hypothetical protein